MNPEDRRRWVTDAHRKLAEAERARYRWLVETSQWHVNGDPQPTSHRSKWVIAVVILVLMQLMWQRSSTEWSVADETVGIEQSE